MDLQLYTIMPLDTEHLEEICQDIRYQYENGTATCALFMMTLVPEGNPPVDKVGVLCRKYDLQNLIRVSLLLGGAVCGALFVMHILTDVNPLIHGVMLGVGTGFSMVSVQMQWGLVGEAIDYNEFITGKRTEGSIYGTFNLARRIGQTIGQGFALYALGWIGYEGTSAVQSTGTIFGMKVLCVLVPAIFILGSWAAFKFVWNITPEVRRQMTAAMAPASAEPKP